jgi:hypothetical protein
MAPNEIRHNNSAVFYLKRNNNDISASMCDLYLVYRGDVYSNTLCCKNHALVSDYI